MSRRMTFTKAEQNSINKKLKKGWNKIAANLKGHDNENYASFPINFCGASIEDTWLDLHSKYFDSSNYKNKKLVPYEEYVKDFLDCAEKFYESMMVELKVRAGEEFDFVDIVESKVKDVKKPGNLTKKALKRAREGEFSKIKHIRYNLRSLPAQTFSEKMLQKNTSDNQNLEDFDIKKDNSLRNHLFIEGLMYFEPLIESTPVLDENTGENKTLKCKKGLIFDNNGYEGFKSAENRCEYYMEIVRAMESIIPGFDRLNCSGHYSGRPHPDLFVNWYLSHLANLDKHGLAFDYRQLQKSSWALKSCCFKPVHMAGSLYRWPGSKLEPSSAAVGQLSYDVDSEAEDCPVAVHNVHDDPKLIHLLREKIKTVPKETLKSYKEDLEQFTRDHRNIRYIWYHPNELAEDANTVNLAEHQIFGDSAGMKGHMEKILLERRLASREEHEGVIKFKTPAMIALQLCMYVEKHPFFQKSVAKWGKKTGLDKRTFKWIAKIICLWDMHVCKSFVDMVEAGMTAYDWPAFAVVQLKNFKETHSKEKINIRLEKNPLFDEWELEDMKKYLELAEVEEIYKRHLFLPCCNKSSSPPTDWLTYQYEVRKKEEAQTSGHVNKKRKL